MTGSKLLLIVSLLTGVFAEECDLTAADIEAFKDRVVVTNASTESGALIGVVLDHATVTGFLAPGTSHTASGLLSTRFTVYVRGPQGSRAMGYRQQLNEVRNTLQNLSIEPGASPEHVSAAATDLLVVVAAQAQLSDTSDDVQTCSGAIENGVDVQVTINSTKTSGGVEVWTLDCG